MNTPETKSSRQADCSGNPAVHLTPEEILEQIPPGIHTSLNPWKMKVTQEDMNSIIAVIKEIQNRIQTGK